MAKQYVVKLTQADRTELLTLTRGGKTSARRMRRAQILLLADEQRSDRVIAEMLHVGISTVARTRQKYVEAGTLYALGERPRRGGERKLNGKQEAVLVALACSTPPGGRRVWTMQLLADKLVELGEVECLSDETVRRVLKKMNLSLGSKCNGVFPK